MKKTAALILSVGLSTSALADVCKPTQQACTEPTTKLDFCKGEFEVSEIATKYVTACDSKMRRFQKITVTQEARDRFFCKCLWQFKWWETFDP